MEKAYNKYTFVNNQEPALSAQTLNDISNAIDTIDDRVVAMGDIQGAAQEALMQAQLANAQTYENSRVAADSAEKAMSTTPSGYNQKITQLNNLRNAQSYSSTKAYTVSEVVDYNNSLYKCKLACSGIIPTNTTYWAEVNVRTIEDDITRLNVDLTDGLASKQKKFTFATKNVTFSNGSGSLGLSIATDMVIAVAGYGNYFTPFLSTNGTWYARLDSNPTWSGTLQVFVVYY